jgi:hypothetical protein
VTRGSGPPRFRISRHGSNERGEQGGLVWYQCYGIVNRSSEWRLLASRRTSSREGKSLCCGPINPTSDDTILQQPNSLSGLFQTHTHTQASFVFSRLFKMALVNVVNMVRAFVGERVESVRSLTSSGANSHDVAACLLLLPVALDRLSWTIPVTLRIPFNSK